jgi:hypothetical protein
MDSVRRLAAFEADPITGGTAPEIVPFRITP